MSEHAVLQFKLC